MVGFEVAIKESSKELSAKERIMYKDTSDAIRLDEATLSGEVVIDVAGYVVLDVHNEKSEDKDYNQYLIIGKDGTKYVTGSESMFSSFINIYNEMKNEDEEYSIKVFRLPSKNFKGKDFLTCTII